MRVTVEPSGKPGEAIISDNDGSITHHLDPSTKTVFSVHGERKLSIKEIGGFPSRRKKNEA
jgi:hypothetical protein